MALSESGRQWGKCKKSKILNLPFRVKAYPLEIILNPKLSVKIISFAKKLGKTLLATVPSCAAGKNTFGHYSMNLELRPMLLGHNTKWVRGSILPIHNFYWLLLKKLRKFEKTVIFWSKFKLPKKGVPHLLWVAGFLR